MSADLDQILVADPPAAWTDAGFTVDPDGVCRIGQVRVRLVGRDHGTGVVGWAWRGLPIALDRDDLDGVPTTASRRPPAEPATHPNGVISIDHVVLLSPDLGRTVAALASIGAEPRRERDGELGGRPVRQIFYRFGDVILEVVGSPDTVTPGPSTVWGITYVVADIDETATFFGEGATPVKAAVQPGRRISTLRNRELGMSVRTALISPYVRER